ncbi:hypothetical protein K2P56_04930, partial [Patescibacteria group bacterium]|nr:hypothetical protein [Patescibacteria group bacterium]
MKITLTQLKTFSKIALAVALVTAEILVPFVPILPALAASGVPQIINFQGRLLDASGNLLGGTSGTNYCFRFSLFNDATVGGPDTQLWPTGTPSKMTLNVTEGVFNAPIGDTALGGDVLDYDFDQDSVYVNVEVAASVSSSCASVTSFENLSPRQRVVSTGFALTAGSVRGAEQTSIGTTTPIANSVLTVTATSTNSVAATIRAIAGQVADIFRVQDSAGNNLVSISATGALSFAFASSTASSFLDYVSVGRTATTTIRGEANATSTFAGGVFAVGLQVDGFASTTALRISSGFFQDGLADCSAEAGTLLYNSTTGKFFCGSDAGGSAGAELNWTFFNNSGIRVSTTTNSVLIGGTSTSTLAKLEVVGDADISTNLNVQQRITALNASTTNLSTTYASSTNAFFGALNLTNRSLGGLAIDALGNVYNAATSTLATIAGTLGLSQIAPQAANTVIGNPTGSSASPTAIATSTFFGVGTNGQILAQVNGAIQWVATTTLSTISGILGVDKGGTGLSSTPALGQLLVGNGTGYTLSATSSLGIALSDTTGVLPATRGGTGLSSIAQFGTFIGGAANTIVQVATSTLGINFADLIGSATDAQVANNLTISGGTIDNTPIGATTPSTAVFTNSTSTNATTTNLAVSGQTRFSSLSLGGLAVDALGRVYAAATSTLATISGVLDLANQV